MNSDLMADFSRYREIWKQPDEANPAIPLGYPGWPEAGLAVMGDFAGIQNFVFRPVPGAGGAARRLRSRSFRVSAYSEMVMRWAWEQLEQAAPKTLYAAGGKFLISAKAFEGWETLIRRMQSEIDHWTWQDFGGELVFHLAAIRFNSGKIPTIELEKAMDTLRNRPLERVLVSSTGWSAQQFFQRAAPGDGKCDACGMTQQVHKNEDGEMVCDACIKDEVNGKELPQALFAHISASGNEHLSVLGKGMRLCDRRTSNNSGDWLAFEADAGDESAWHLFRNVPKKASGATMDFDDIANLSPGLRKWLGYLRIDGDGAGKHFRNLKGEPRRIWALSRLLNLFFTESANRLVSRRFTNIYPVYGGGDDLFVIGPWNEVLDFALELRRELNYIVGNDLTFSAGMSLAKPKEHILTQAEFAREQLDSAKKDPGYGRPCGRDQIRALGVTAGWDTFRTLNESAKQVTKWIEDKEIPNSFLHQVLQLHNAWKQCLGTSNGKATAKLVRYKPLLYYQIQRNLKAGKAQDWAHGLLQAGSLWPWADFIARYAMLAAEREKTKE